MRSPFAVPQEQLGLGPDSARGRSQVMAGAQNERADIGVRFRPAWLRRRWVVSAHRLWRHPYEPNRFGPKLPPLWPCACFASRIISRDYVPKHTGRVFVAERSRIRKRAEEFARQFDLSHRAHGRSFSAEPGVIVSHADAGSEGLAAATSRLRSNADRTDGTEEPEPRRAVANRSHHALQRTGEGLSDSGRDLRHHRRGYPALRRHQHPGGAAARARRGGRAHRRQQMVDRHSRLRKPADPIRSGTDRRPHGLHAAL